MRKSTIVGIFAICIALVLFSSIVIAGNNESQIVITYGETTYNDQNLLNTVNNYFAQKGYSDLSNAKIEVIDANEVNEISQGISGRTYNSNQIFSSALLDLTQNGNLTVKVDTSTVNLITARMYASALESAGITHGSVYVTSPVSATGESALAGIMNCYEKATNTQIPDEVKQAANEEIYTQAEILNNSNIDADSLSQMVDQVKNETQDKNITNLQDIIDIVNETAEKNHIDLSYPDIEKIAQAIYDTLSVQDKANDYKNQLNKIFN